MPESKHQLGILVAGEREFSVVQTGVVLVENQLFVGSRAAVHDHFFLQFARNADFVEVEDHLIMAGKTIVRFQPCIQFKHRKGLDVFILLNLLHDSVIYLFLHGFQLELSVLVQGIFSRADGDAMERFDGESLAVAFLDDDFLFV